MPKATFLQTLLNRPTKKYTFPPPAKDYALQRGEFARAAQADKGSQGSSASAGSTLVQEQDMLVHAPDLKHHASAGSWELVEPKLSRTYGTPPPTRK
ncbi:hypothetical protein HWV62_28942 [Athelia sp. TMB]|nr:hypothetical protein HWV62_28942 [Athelia sp. TMB]